MLYNCTTGSSTVNTFCCSWVAGTLQPLNGSALSISSNLRPNPGAAEVNQTCIFGEAQGAAAFSTPDVFQACSFGAFQTATYYETRTGWRQANASSDEVPSLTQIAWCATGGAERRVGKWSKMVFGGVVLGVVMGVL